MATNVAGRLNVEESRKVNDSMRATLKVLRNFYQYSAANVMPFAYNIAASLDVTKFPNLKVAPKDITALTDTLRDKLAATQTGGTVETAAKQKAFEALCDALNADANVVEDTVGDDLEMLLATGYLPTSNNRSSSPLDDTSIVSLLNNGTTQALLRLEPVTNAKTYQVQISTDGGKTWLEAGISRQARRIVLNNLTPGTNYLVRARAIGGSTGASAWTSPGSIMST